MVFIFFVNSFFIWSGRKVPPATAPKPVRRKSAPFGDTNSHQMPNVTLIPCRENVPTSSRQSSPCPRQSPKTSAKNAGRHFLLATTNDVRHRFAENGADSAILNGSVVNYGSSSGKHSSHCQEARVSSERSVTGPFDGWSRDNQDKPFRSLLQDDSNRKNYQPKKNYLSFSFLSLSLC